ncbi:MAG: hypothetical protein RI883_2236 [Bacteroidota bacterium]|jgi:hypothetical protein
MKHFVFISLFFFFIACSNSPKTVVGKWKLESIDYSPYFLEVSDEVKTMFQEKMEDQTKRMIGKTFFEFKIDNSLRLESPNFENEIVPFEGKWKFNQTEDSITFDLDGEEHYKINTLTENKLILSTDESPKRILSFSKVDL